MPPRRTPIRPEAATFVDLVQRRAQDQPNRLAYAYLVDGERERESLTYGELGQRVAALADGLRERGATGERVLLLLPPGLDYVAAFWATLAAGATAVPVYPPRAGRSVHALDAIVADADAKFAIGALPKTRTPIEGPLAAVTMLLPEELQGRSVWPDRPIAGPRDLAVLQYTSGSTSTPRAAMMSHAHLLASAYAIQGATHGRPDDVEVSWLPLYHDMGLFGSVINPLLHGVPVYFMAPLAFLQRPARWLEAISELHGTAAGAPNFAYDLCVDTTKPEDRERLDLSSWRIAMNGAEPIRPATIERFTEAFAPAGFRRSTFFSAYGLAEAMLVASGQDPKWAAVDAEDLGANRVRAVEADSPGARLVVSCGRPPAGIHVEIVDPETELPAGDGRVGEIWAAGSSVVSGYWRKPAESKRLLRARLPDDRRRYLRTGDLGFVANGEVHVTGRLKELLIIRGRNYYPVDLERTVEASHDGVRRNGVAAIAVPGSREERLGIVAELRRSGRPDPDAVLAAIRRSLAEEHELRVARVALIPEGRLPRTSSGKIQRLAALRLLDEGQLHAVLDWSDGAGSDADRVPDAANLPQGQPVRLPDPTARPRPGVQRSTAAIEAWLVAHLAERLKVDAGELDPGAPFASFGIGSVEATALAGELATWLERPLSPTLTWDYPTIRRLAQHLADEDEEPAEDFVASPQEPIAIVGLGVRFPGAPNLTAFRDLLRNGRDAITEAPPERIDFAEIYDPNPATPGKAVSKNGGFLEGIDLFDPQFFGISPREAARMDPQQRLLLEMAEEALEDAAMPPSRLAGSSTGVFVGIGSFEYTHVQRDAGGELAAIDAYQGTGNAHSIAANRISFLYDLRGPSIAIDTACSSSLVALHLATQSLLNRESDVALAGGVNVILSPDLTIAFSQARMLSPAGHSKSFDASADGYVRSEGAGMVVLKRLSDARRDGDRVIALIRGTAVNQDGLTSGITAPSGRAQQEVIRTALARAGIAPDALGAIEAHGTGTPLGDPIEVNALAEVVGPASDPDRRIWLGSVKANVGHMEMASGMAGLAKAVLELSYGEIYPQVHFQDLNPHIRIEGTGLTIPTVLEKWPMGPRPRYIGVSSFGFGGTNAHVILEESREAIEPRSHVERPLHIVTMSAKTEGALQRLAESLSDAVAAEPNLPLEDVAYTANVGRSRHLHRASVVAESLDKLRERLARVAEGRTGPGVAVGRRSTQQPPIAFLFTGQGAQYAGMGRLLYDTQPTFRAALDRCAALLDAHLDRPLLSLLYLAEGEADLLAETVYTQPALFALEYALAELWRSWGIVPDVVLGHSVGEYVAACVAGALSLEDATRLIAARGRLMHGLPRDGAMAAVLAPLERVEAALADEPDVEVSGVNAPENITISGRREGVERVLETLRSDAVSVVPLNVSHAFHSPLMDPILDEFEAIARTIEPRPLQIALATNYDGQLLAPGATLDAAYWRNHARHAVRFADDLRAAHEYGAQIFLEVGPGPTLTGMGRRVLAGTAAKWAASLKPGENDWAAILSGLATVFTAGRDVDWVGFDRDYRRRLVMLPTYPFERTRHWFQAEGLGRSVTGTATADRGHALIRTVVGSPLPTIQAKVRADSPAWLTDHRVQGAVVVPASMLVELLLAAVADRETHGALGAAAEESTRDISAAIDDVDLSRALFLGESGVVVQAVTAPDESGGDVVRVFSRPESGADVWTLHATARASRAREDAAATGLEAIEAARARCATQVPTDDFYGLLATRGLEYGPAFRGVASLWRGDGEAVAEVVAPAAIAPERDGWLFHPALLDAAFQVFAASLPAEGATGGTYLPIGFRRVRLHRRPTERLWVHARLAPGFEDAVAVREGDLQIVDDAGRPVAEIAGLRVQQIEPDASRAGAADRPEAWQYDVAWIPAAVAEDATAPTRRWLVLGAGPVASAVADALRLAGHEAAVHDAPPSADGEALARSLVDGPAHDAILCLWPLAPVFGAEHPATNGHTPAGGNGNGNGAPAKAAAVHRAGTAAAGNGHVQAVATTIDGNGRAAATGTSRNGHRNGKSNGKHAASDDVLHELTDPAVAVLRLIRALAGSSRAHMPSITILTRGGQAGFADGDDSSLGQAAVIGLVRAARIEHPELRLAIVDVDPALPMRDAGDAVVRALPVLVGEQEVAVRGDLLLVRRLISRTAAKATEDDDIPGVGEAAGSDDVPASDEAASEAGAIAEAGPAADASAAAVGLRLPVGPYRLEPAEQGVLDGLALRPAPRRTPGPGEVEIAVDASGVNFRDVMKALGIYPQTPGDVLWLGDEVAGRVVAAGEGVDLAVGDAVFGVAPAAFAAFATTRSDFLLRLPKGLAAEDAATLPIAFATALYGLKHLAQLQPGERVLIHAAAGGVGQAAIQIAQALGAEVYATASEGKRDYLRSLGVRHVFDSRSLAFVDDLREATGGQGVDVVLNSLAGEFIPASIASLAPYGRFVEIGKRDIFQNARIGLWPFRNNLSFFAVDMDRIFRDRPAVGRGLLDEIRAGFEAGFYRPLPKTTFPMTSAVSAFRYLAQARNVGKVVLTSVPVVEAGLDEATPQFVLRDDATYLVTGGTRGLGGRVAEWLATRGAKHLVLVGRDIASPAAQETAQRVLAAGATPTLLAADLGSPGAVASVLATVRETLPALRGIVHAAGVLADATILKLDDERFRSVFASKAVAATALDRATRDAELDFFISFSSIASVLGNAGQANYAAANAVLDRLAWLRAAHGRPAQTINWGPWAEIGMSATAEGQRMLSFGVRQIPPAAGIGLLEGLIEDGRPEPVVVAIDWPRFISLVPGAARDPFLSVVAASADSGRRSDGSEALTAILNAPPAEGQGLVEAFVRAELAKVLELSPDDLPLDQPLNTVGLDSLMALELKNRVESALLITLPIVALIQGPTITQLSEDLLARVQAGPSAAGAGDGGAADGIDGAAARELATLQQGAAPAPRM